MLKEIASWILKNFDYDVKINYNEYTDSLAVEFENKKKIARFVLWDDRSCMIEIIDVDMEKYLINERRELNDNLDVMDSFREFVDLLRS